MMRTWTARTVWTTVLALFATHFNAYGQPSETYLRLSPEAWDVKARGEFEGWTDRRALLVLHHPWEVSESGPSVSAAQTVQLPADWKAPFRLHFYASDDYDGSMDPVEEEWLGQMNLPGHRFKEALVNGEVVWRQDVADSADIAAPVRFAVELPASVQPGDPVEVVFRLLDAVGSMERLAGDHRYIGTTDGITEDAPWNFMTNLYIGDVMLSPASTDAVPPLNMPSIDLARAEHGDAWPRRPVSEPVTFPVSLAVRHAPEGHVPFLVQCGIPFPLSALDSPDSIRLTGPDGAPIACSAETMNTWPDGSVRFARLTALLPAGCRSVLLDIDGSGDRPSPPGLPTPFRLAQDKTGALVAGFEAFRNLYFTLEINDQHSGLFPDSIEKAEEGALHSIVEARGRIRSTEPAESPASFGGFVLRATTYAGQPYVRLFFRVFNDRPETLKITDMSLVGVYSDHVMPDGVDSQASLAQTGPEAWTFRNADGETVHHTGQAPSFIHNPAEGNASPVTVVVRHFAEQFPKAMHADGTSVEIQLVTSTADYPAYQPHEGEAKRHELWLLAGDNPSTPEERDAYGTWMADPPGLFDADYFCATGAFGMAAPHDDTRFPELTAFMKQTYGEIPASMFYETGIRHFGDLPYNAEDGTWRNGYYDVQQGFFSEYLMTGDDRWFDHLEASVRHIMDIDICHGSEDHPDWVGAIHGLYSKDHSQGDPWNPTQRTKGMLNYWRLTGDRDARDAALGVADSAIAAGRAIGATSVRDHAGILYCLVAAYDETREQKYLDAARAVAHDAMKRIDPRRGCYAEIHGNYSYRGNVPWMVAQLMEPMYDYYRASGDVDAAAAVVGMAESILSENRTRDVPGDVFGYSHNPHFSKNSGYHILIAPAILYAHDLTGDGEFFRQGRAMYEQTIAEGTVNSVMNCYWNTHTLLYFLQHGD